MSDAPFPHRVFDDFVPADLLANIAKTWPSPEWKGWVRYDPRFEQKLASDLLTHLPHPMGVAIARMAAENLGGLVEQPLAIADLSLWGGGLHEILPGSGGLGCHLDASIHARLGLRRAYSAILWVHPRWVPSWGGELVLYDRQRKPVVKIEPRPGRLAVFATGDHSWHGVLPVRGGYSRKSLALFGYCEAPDYPPHARTRALFVAAEGEDDSPEARAARAARAG